MLSCLELDQPELALTYVDGIDNWRKGLAYATLAKYYAENNGGAAEAERYLSHAGLISSSPLGQVWRADRIKGRMAQARYLLGQHEEADKLEQFAVDSEAGQVDLVRVRELNDCFTFNRCYYREPVTALQPPHCRLRGRDVDAECEDAQDGKKMQANLHFEDLC